MNRRWLIGAATALVLLAGLPAPAQPGSITVFAASSLTTAFTEIGGAYEKAHAGVAVRFNFAASSALRSQLQLGTPADVFASADREQLEPLEKAGLAVKPVVFAHNRLTMVVPKENPAKLRSPKDLARSGLRLVSTSEAVPIGRYTGEALEKLGGLPGYPADFAGRVKANVVSREPNVRAVLAKVELGEADAAIVYETDARSSSRVTAISIPEKANVIAEYPIAVIGNSANRETATDFVRFVRSKAGRVILQRYGFR